MSDETPRKLSYDPAKLPNPMGATEHYSYAMLIEMRALRSVVTQLVDILTTIAVALPVPPVDTPKAPKAK